MFIDVLKYSGVALVVFLVIDALWLGVIAKNFYSTELGVLLRANPNLLVAGLLYVILAAALSYFVILPALAAGDITQVILAGLFFGFATYATYNLTNLATIDGYSVKLAVVDLLWGSFLVSSVSTITYLIFR